MHCGQSITLSARRWNDGGIVRPNALAVQTMITNSTSSVALSVGRLAWNPLSDGSGKRPLVDSPWEDAMPQFIPARSSKSPDVASARRLHPDRSRQDL
jgi:hypothetical protein